MKQVYASKLLFKKYTWRVRIEIPVEDMRPKKHFTEVMRSEFIKPYLTWLQAICGKDYKKLVSWRRKTIRTVTRKGRRDIRTSKQIHVCHMLLYVSNDATYKQILNKFDQYVIEITAPANEAHAELIRQGNTIEVRDKLYYDQYRYKMSFWRTWRHEIQTEISASIKNHLHDDTKAVQDYYATRSQCTLYMKEFGDFVTMKIVLSQHVKQIVIVSLLSDLIPASTP